MAAFVSLIGAGPGDPELITLRGQRALAAADVIIHDELVDRRLLIPFADRPVYGLGDRRAPAPARRQRLHRLLAEQAAAGRRVAHLKGGDPLLFARAVEEILFLRAAGIPYEVVPGITAAVAAAAYAELPLTRRRQASSVAFCTGHTAQVAVPGADTLVYYMAAARLAAVAQRLLAAGWSPAAPVTLVRNASPMCTARGVCGLAFTSPARRGEAFAELARGFETATFIEDAGATADVARTMFGEPADGDGIGLHLRGTPFQIKIWRALLAIPPGCITSYGDLAHRIGAPGASRATGNAIASNPIAWIIPCHRVIRASGVLGGYRWGRGRKLAMLSLEAGGAVPGPGWAASIDHGETGRAETRHMRS